MKNGIFAAFIILPLVIYGRSGQVKKTSSDYVAKSESAQSKRKLRIHTVKKGETLYSISRKYGLSPAQITKSNGLNSNYLIKAGMKLKLWCTSYPFRNTLSGMMKNFQYNFCAGFDKNHRLIFLAGKKNSFCHKRIRHL